jgi:glycosyltransferase involved in cell wall biosynthesis
MNSPDGDVFPYRVPKASACMNETGQRPFVVMYHGSLLARNGVDLAVDAVAKVRERIPSIVLRIYGDRCAFLDRVMASVRDRGLDGTVQYLGSKTLQEIVTQIESCDVGVIPNHRNAFTEINTPTRIFEYLATGKPVVAPRTPGITDYFGDDSLVFFEAGNADDLARQIEYVATHRDEALRITEHGQEVYLAHTWEKEREVLTRVVSDLLQSEPA